MSEAKSNLDPEQASSSAKLNTAELGRPTPGELGPEVDPAQAQSLEQIALTPKLRHSFSRSNSRTDSEAAKSIANSDITFRELQEELCKSDDPSGIMPAELDLDQTYLTADNHSLADRGNLEPLYEVALDEPHEEPVPKAKRPSFIKSVRFYVIAIALISSFATTYSKSLINYAILDMVVRPEPAQITTTTPIPYPDSDNITSTTARPEIPSFDRDGSCPVKDPKERERLIQEQSKDKIREQTPGEKFRWSADKEAWLQMAYSIGHIPLMTFGSRMSEVYGPHSVMTLSSLGMGLSCFLAPALANMSYYFIFLDLVLLGVLGSFMTPALITMISNWLTPNERAIGISLYLVVSRLGSGLIAYVSLSFREYGISWRYVFLSAGVINFIFCSSFHFVASSKPKEHRYMSKLELGYLASKNKLVQESLNETDDEQSRSNGNELELKDLHKQRDDQPSDKQLNKQNSKKKVSELPWLHIFRSAPVWAFVLTKLCVKIAGDLPQCALDQYLNRVMHIPESRAKIFVLMNYILFSTGALISSIVARKMNKLQAFNLSKTQLRKIFQSIASFGVGFCMLGIGLCTCNELVAYILLGFTYFLTTLGTSGEAQSPTDLSERYSGTLHAIASSIASGSGLLVPLFVARMRRYGPYDVEVWKLIWLTAAVISCIGGAIFLLFAEAKIQPFDLIKMPKHEVIIEVEPGIEVIPIPGNPREKLFVEPLTGLVRKASVMSDIPEVEDDEEKPYRESRMI